MDLHYEKESVLVQGFENFLLFLPLSFFYSGLISYVYVIYIYIDTNWVVPLLTNSHQEGVCSLLVLDPNLNLHSNQITWKGDNLEQYTHIYIYIYLNFIFLLGTFMVSSIKIHPRFKVSMLPP